MAELYKGAPVAERINNETSFIISELRGRGIDPTLAILRVGGRGDDIAYEKSAEKRCAAVGVSVRKVILPENAAQTDLISAVSDLNLDLSVHGVIVLNPLPAHLDLAAVRGALDPRKDVDGVTSASLAGVFTGNGEGYPPCTAQACMEILDHYGVHCAGKNAVVIGRSLVVGRPAAIMLMNKNATVTVCHTYTKNTAQISSAADIVIVAAGKMETMTSEYFSAGQTVIDVGTTWSAEKQRLCGDVKFSEVSGIVAAVTPVPGGVGGVTASVLVRHVAEAALRAHNTDEERGLKL